MAPPKRQQRTQALDNLGDPPAGYVLTGDPDADTIARDANHADDTYASPIAVTGFAAEFVS